MRTFKIGDSQSVLATLEEIVELLAGDKYAKAFELFEEHEYTQYTPEDLRDTIETYFEDEPGKKVTSAYSAGEPPAYSRESHDYEDDEFVSVVHAKFPYCVCWAKDGDGLEAMYAHVDLPLNDAWSDLTVKFDLVGEGGKCWLVLEDIEEM